ncbi:MAG: purine-nucleoside phosphorylase [Planctomycetota bacterium]|jgi:purine-nucleoside phosphorylase
MSRLKATIDEAAEAIRAKCDLEPEIGIILGTGLGALAGDIDKQAEIPYDEIPHFSETTLETHAGNLILGRLGGKNVVAMEGRFHIYEGYTMQQVTLPVRVMKALGAKSLVVSNACGCLNAEWQKGDLIIIEDHINLMCDNPLIGPNDDELGPRYPDMIESYCKAYIEAAERIASEEGIRAHRGVYAAMTGPCLETRAEYRMLQIIGADAIGMSTVPEVIVAVHAGLKTFGVGILTDVCLPEALEPVNIEEIIAVANEAEPKLTRLIERLIEVM